MVIGRLRKTLKRSLAAAMAVAMMATSVPQFSVTAMAQEEVYEEQTSEKAATDRTDEGTIQDGDSAGSKSTEEKKDNAETQEMGTR